MHYKLERRTAWVPTTGFYFGFMNVAGMLCIILGGVISTLVFLGTSIAELSWQWQCWWIGAKCQIVGIVMLEMVQWYSCMMGNMKEAEVTGTIFEPDTYDVPGPQTSDKIMMVIGAFFGFVGAVSITITLLYPIA